MDISKFKNPTAKDLRVFALVLGALLGLFGFLSWRKTGTLWPWFWGFGGGSAILGLVWPKGITPVYHAWIRVASVIAAVNTFVVMSVLYYFVFTPIALFMRLKGEDPLERALNPAASSYWKTREAGDGRDRLERQF
jgi:hypothetical protein